MRLLLYPLFEAAPSTLLLSISRSMLIARAKGFSLLRMAVAIRSTSGVTPLLAKSSTFVRKASFEALAARVGLRQLPVSFSPVSSSFGTDTTLRCPHELVWLNTFRSALTLLPNLDTPAFLITRDLIVLLLERLLACGESSSQALKYVGQSPSSRCLANSNEH